MAVAPLPTPPNAASQSASGTRVLPATPASGAGNTGANPLATAATQLSGQGGTTPAVQTLSAKALMTLLQALGKPMGGTVGAGASSNALPITLQGAPSPSGSAAQLQATLPMPTGAKALAVGTPVQVDVDGTSSNARILVTVTGPANASPDTVRTDAARQSSLAPLLADVARLNGQSKTPAPLQQVFERLMGLTLSGDSSADADTLRQSLESARAPLPGASTPIGANATGLPSTAQPLSQALAALVRALGLTAGSPNASRGAEQSPGRSGNASTPMPQGNQPSRLPAQALPLDMPDLGDPAVLQSLKSKAEAALSRANLMQAQDAAPQSRAPDVGTAIRLDLPMLIGQEAAVLGLIVDQDNTSETADERQGVTWRFRFAFETKAHGGVEGYVALRQSEREPALDIGVRVSNADVLAALEATRSQLAAQMEMQGLAVINLTLTGMDGQSEAQVKASDTSGTPHEPHFVDISS